MYLWLLMLACQCNAEACGNLNEAVHDWYTVTRADR